MDFYDIAVKNSGSRTAPVTTLYPDWQARRWSDLMVRGGQFYAVWDEEEKLWTTDLFRLIQMVDKEMIEAKEPYSEKHASETVKVALMRDNSSMLLRGFNGFCKDAGSWWKPLDAKLIFANQESSRTDYVSSKIPYELRKAPTPCWDELTSVLYDPEELRKIMWVVGCVVAGETRRIQKMVLFSGAGGKGKSTMLDIITKLFPGHWGSYMVRDVMSRSNQFQLAAFKKNHLVMVDHEADFSLRFSDSSSLKMLISHDELLMNEKGVQQYNMSFNGLLFAATNKEVMLEDSQDGLIRRLLDVIPTGNLVPRVRYDQLVRGIDTELGGIAYSCLKVYQEMGHSYYDKYQPTALIRKSSSVYDFIGEYFNEFVEREYILAGDAMDWYRAYSEKRALKQPLSFTAFKKELETYFDEFHLRKKIDGKNLRSVYMGFKIDRFMDEIDEPEFIEPEQTIPEWLNLKEQESPLDILAADMPAMYAIQREDGWGGETKWANNKKTLKDIDTSRPHWVQYPIDHIVIDFDIKDADGNKSYELNQRAAAEWPPTYCETSQGGAGLHLHYFYEGDATQLAPVMPDNKNVEIKVYTGNASDRRRLSRCNTHDISKIPVGSLPIKEKKQVINTEFVETEKSLRRSIEKALRKEVHPNTASNVDFIAKLLDDAYSAGVVYDVSDLRGRVQTLAARSTNQSLRCMKLVTKMKFASEKTVEEASDIQTEPEDQAAPIAFFDIEVFPNLLLICWKILGEDKKVGTLINPTPSELEPLFKLRLVGFNNRMYDNHILMGRYQGDTIEECYKRSQRIIMKKDRDAYIPSAYGLSYGDIRDISSTPMKSLKKWEIELGIHHQELALDWTEPQPEERWEEIGKYCANDVEATEQVWLKSKSDVKAREILSTMSGLPFNDTTRKHASKILFGVTNGDDHKKEFQYTDLSEMFPGYEFKRFGGSGEYTEDDYTDTTRKEIHESTYRGEVVGEGGYVYSEPGYYEDVALIDVASMHPTSIEQLNLFGEYTKNFSDIKAARVAIKHGEWDKARTMLDGKLAPFLNDESEAKALSNALKLVINKVYGFTSATFDNTFLDKRNVDNIVAKRGALFMIDLKNYVQEEGFTVAHIKTDSIKIPNATPEIIEKVMEFGKKYGYDFEHEATYKRMVLLDRAQYIALDDEGWHATGKAFLRPFVFKSLFSHEDFDWKDYAVDFSVQTSLWLDYNEGLPEGEHDRHHVGKVGLFYPVIDGVGGAELVRQDKDDEERFSYASGAKDQRWMEVEHLESREREDWIDISYHQKFVDDVTTLIEQYIPVKELTA